MKKVLIFGAVKHAIEKAKELGYEVILVDQNPNIKWIELADKFKCIPFENFEENLKFAIENEVDGIVNATDFAVLVSSYVAERIGLPGLSYEAAKIAKNKFEIRKIMQEKNITNVAQFFEISQLNQVYDIKDKINFPIILKPCSGLGSLFVYKINNYEDLVSKVPEVLEGSFNGKALIETFIEGQEYGVESFVYNNVVNVLAIMKKNMTQLPYRSELGHSIPSELPIEIENKIKEVVSNLIKAIGINQGAVNMDLILTSDNIIYVVDVGARMGGNAISSHIIPNGTGIDHVGNVVKLAMKDDTIDITPKYNKCVATRILNLDEGIIKGLPDFSEFFDDDVIEICFEKKVGDMIEKYISDAQRCGFVVVKGDDITATKQKALMLRNKINESIIRG